MEQKALLLGLVLHSEDSDQCCECCAYARFTVALTSFRVLPYCQVDLIVPIGQQIIYLLLVNLQVRHRNL